MKLPAGGRLRASDTITNEAADPDSVAPAGSTLPAGTVPMSTVPDGMADGMATRVGMAAPNDEGPGAGTAAAVASLAGSLVLVAAVAAAGARWTDAGPGSWYDGLSKPSWTPPGGVFAGAWTALYALMAIAAWWVARSGLRRPLVRRALALYAVQLALNLGWTWVFFRLQRPGWALVEILALDAVVLATVAAFWSVRRRAAVLLVPYVGWLAFATALTGAIVSSN
jgi:benzodiazapine receptor